MEATPLTVLSTLFETLQVFLSYSENVHVVLSLSSRYFCYQPFPFFQLNCFPGQITIRIFTLWAQLLLEFSTDHFDTMHTWSVDVHVVLGFSSYYF